MNDEIDHGKRYTNAFMLALNESGMDSSSCLRVLGICSCAIALKNGYAEKNFQKYLDHCKEVFLLNLEGMKDG